MNGPQFRVEDPTKKDTDKQVFARFDLKSEIPNPHGDIAARLIEAPDGTNAELLWGLKKNSRYPPEAHAYSHILTIKEGSGIISINGQYKLYKAGDVFDIAGNIPHGFVKVNETTVVSQK